MRQISLRASSLDWPCSKSCWFLMSRMLVICRDWPGCERLAQSWKQWELPVESVECWSESRSEPVKVLRMNGCCCTKSRGGKSGYKILCGRADYNWLLKFERRRSTFPHTPSPYLKRSWNSYSSSCWGYSRKSVLPLQRTKWGCRVVSWLLQNTTLMEESAKRKSKIHIRVQTCSIRLGRSRNGNVWTARRYISLDLWSTYLACLMRLDGFFQDPMYTQRGGGVIYYL